MKLANLFLGLALVSAAGVAQARFQSLNDRLKIHDARLPHPSHDLYKVHSRRLAFDQKNGRHQFRVMNHRQHHTFRKDVRSVAHHVTAPHHH